MNTPTGEMPRQLVVLARGLNPDGTPNQATIERAASAAAYFHSHDADRIILSGGRSFLAGSGTNGQRTESEVMAEIAEEHGLPSWAIHIPAPSTNTVTNLTTSAPFVRENEAVGIMAHGDQLPRGLWLARRILINECVGAPATGEYGRSEVRQELAMFTISRLLYAGLPQGNVARYARRNIRIEETIKKCKPILGKLLGNSNPYS